jgi:hypothetical protein
MTSLPQAIPRGTGVDVEKGYTFKKTLDLKIKIMQNI